MTPEDFDFETDRVVAAVRERSCRKVLLQFPEGLKRRAPGVAMAISAKSSAAVVISGEPCFGACDIPGTDADLIVHYGHLPLPCLETPNSVLYIQARSSADPIPALEAALPGLEGRVGLLTTAQHIHCLGAMIVFLKSRGVEAIAGKGDSRIFSDGQVLGCNASCARALSGSVDSFLFVGTGDFHALAMALAVPKPVLAADPVTGEVKDMAPVRDRMLRRRHAAVERARQARRFGVLVSSKQGQRRERLAIYVRDMLSDAGLESVLVEMGTVSPGKLDSFGLDAWVSTACPRLALDDYDSFPAPVLTPPEAEIAVGKRAWSAYVFDEIV